MKKRIRVAYRVKLLGAATLSVIGFAAWPIHVQDTEPLDLGAVALIRDEAMERSRVMEIAWHLTELHGPRLPGSPNHRAAAEYARGVMTDWGLSNARLESWGPFGSGWSNERFYAHAVSPQAYPLIGYPFAWTPGTDGWVTGEAMIVRIESDEDFDRYKGTLKGKFVLTEPPRDVKPRFEWPQFARRFPDEELARMEEGYIWWEDLPAEYEYFDARRLLRPQLTEFFLQEGIAAWLVYGAGDGGRVDIFCCSPRRPGKPTIVGLIPEHYGRIYRTLERGYPVTLEMNIQNRVHTEDINSYNVLAEIPGSDKAQETVMLGAHLDSWHAGTGAGDNAAGVVVVMEAVRILMAVGLEMRRTVRVALWGVEEHPYPDGAFSYVRQHLADLVGDSVIPKPTHADLSVYFNLDTGTGRIRGVYLQGNDRVAPVFERWMEPFHDLGMTVLSPRSVGGSDHFTFDWSGIPAFLFIQDPVADWAHHSSMDTYDRLIEADLKQAAAIMASFVYHAANREEKLPRKPETDSEDEGSGLGR